MTRFIPAFVLVTLAFAPALVQATPAPSSSANYSCQQLAEIKNAAGKVVAKQNDRDRINWQVRQAERLCKQGNDQQAKGYLDLAHSMVIQDHTH